MDAFLNHAQLGMGLKDCKRDKCLTWGPMQQWHLLVRGKFNGEGGTKKGLGQHAMVVQRPSCHRLVLCPQCGTNIPLTDPNAAI